MFLDEFLKQQDVRVAHAGLQTERSVGLGLLVARNENEARHVAGAAQSRKAGNAVPALKPDDEVQTEIGNGGKRMAGIYGLRREHGIDLVSEIGQKKTPLLFGQFIIVHQMHIPFPQQWHELLQPVLACHGKQGRRLAANFRKLPGRTHAVGLGTLRALAVLPQHLGHAHHEELVQVVVEYGKKLGLFQQGKPLVQRRFQHPGIEVQPAQFPVQVIVLRGQIDFLLTCLLRCRTLHLTIRFDSIFLLRRLYRTFFLSVSHDYASTLC